MLSFTPQVLMNDSFGFYIGNPERLNEIFFFWNLSFVDCRRPKP